MSLNFHSSSRIGFHSAICLAEYNLATEWYERRNKVERSEVEEEEATWLQSCECSKHILFSFLLLPMKPPEYHLVDTK